jgi:hypothetical protein
MLIPQKGAQPVTVTRLPGQVGCEAVLISTWDVCSSVTLRVIEQLQMHR